VLVRQSWFDLGSCRGMVPPQVLYMWSRTPSRAILRIHPLPIVPNVQVPSMLHRPIILLVSFLPVDPEIPKLLVTLFTNQLMPYENNEKCIELVSYLCKAGTVDVCSGGEG
jgi:hypothetical protein